MRSETFRAFAMSLPPNSEENALIRSHASDLSQPCSHLNGVKAGSEPRAFRRSQITWHY